MSQSDFGTIDPNSKSGPQLALDLNKFRDALNSSHRGSVRPAYAQAGMLWVRETSSTQWDLMLFDGDTDFVLRSINPATNQLIKIPADAIGGLGTASAATLQTSKTDYSPGLALTPGAFGWGINNENLNAPNSNLDTLRLNGVFRTASTITGTMLGASIGQTIHMGQAADFACQLAFQTQGAVPVIRSRVLSSGVWGAPFELLHTGNQITLGTTDVSARAALALGTGAVATVTASSNDATPGRVVKNGDRQVCSAWVNFDGTGTPTIRDSFNVSSITDNGVGDYTVNFSAAMTNTSYSVMAQALDAASGTYAVRGMPSKTAAGTRMYFGGSSSVADYPQISFHFFGGK